MPQNLHVVHRRIQYCTPTIYDHRAEGGKGEAEGGGGGGRVDRPDTASH